MKRPQWLPLCALLAAGASCAAEPAPLRDPMQPPAGLQPAPPAPEGGPPASAFVARHLMVVDGRRYLVDEGRRYAVGELLGNARIERIDDASVWLREAGVLRQLSLHGGVAKHVAPANEPAPIPSALGAARAASSPRSANR